MAWDPFDAPSRCDDFMYKSKFNMRHKRILVGKVPVRHFRKHSARRDPVEQIAVNAANVLRKASKKFRCSNAIEIRELIHVGDNHPIVRRGAQTFGDYALHKTVLR
jgi:hypothetical protein